MALELFGWDLLYRSVENDLIRKEDSLIAFTHWFIIKNGFVCIGNGDSKVVTGDEPKSESLPAGWNRQDDYNLRYIYDERLYLLRASKTGDDIIFNFLRSDDLSISSCVFKVEETVAHIKGNISIVIPNYKNVLTILRKELIDPVFSRITHSAAGTQTSETNRPSARIDPYSPEDPDPLAVGPRRPYGVDQPWYEPRRDPTGVGRSDLDPFAAPGRGGMLFDPFGPRTDRRGLDPLGPAPNFPQGLPRGAVPPGARFDPFGPPGTGPGRGNRRPGPDPDHLPPPGYDDMFM